MATDAGSPPRTRCRDTAIISRDRPKGGRAAPKAKTVGSAEPRTRAPLAGGELGDDGGTGTGLVDIAERKGVRLSDLPWIPDESYRRSKNLPHRLGVNVFFCALIEASRAREGHCLVSWRPEHWVRTKAAEVKPDGFGRYLYPAGACEFYLEYDRGTEAFGALSRKLEGYLRLASG